MSEILNKRRNLPVIEIRGDKKFAQAYLGMCAQIEEPQYKGVYFIPFKKKNETYKYILFKDYARYPDVQNKLRYLVELVDEQFNVVETKVKLPTSGLRKLLGIRETTMDKKQRLESRM